MDYSEVLIVIAADEDFDKEKFPELLDVKCFNDFLDIVNELYLNICDKPFYKSLLSHFTIRNIYPRQLTNLIYFLSFEKYYGFDEMYDFLFDKVRWIFSVIRTLDAKLQSIELFKKYIIRFIESNPNERNNFYTRCFPLHNIENHNILISLDLCTLKEEAFINFVNKYSNSNIRGKTEMITLNYNMLS